MDDYDEDWGYDPGQFEADATPAVEDLLADEEMHLGALDALLLDIRRRPIARRIPLGLCVRCLIEVLADTNIGPDLEVRDAVLDSLIQRYRAVQKQVEAVRIDLGAIALDHEYAEVWTCCRCDPQETGLHLVRGGIAESAQ